MIGIGNKALDDQQRNRHLKSDTICVRMRLENGERMCMQCVSTLMIFLYMQSRLYMYGLVYARPLQSIAYVTHSNCYIPIELSEIFILLLLLFF